MEMKYVIADFLIESADKIRKNECGLLESEMVYLASLIMHVKVNKTQAAVLDENIGFTYTNSFKLESIIQISNWTNKFLLINTIAHESRHLLQHISNYYQINENSEDVCYLLAYIVLKIYEICVKNKIL